MNFVIITKQELQKIPPLISVAYILNDNGHSVTIISCGITQRIKDELRRRGIASEEYPYAQAKSFWGKAKEYFLFRMVVNKRLRSLSFDYLWVEAGYTIRSLGKSLLKHKFILQLSELHEDSPAQIKAIGKVISQASLIFMPEYNRTYIYRAWFHLEKSPIVLPNKPYYLPDKEELNSIRKNYADKLEVFEKYKVILFQGLITSDRDLSAFAKAVNELGDDYRLVLLGRDFNLVEKYRSYCPKLIHIDFITPPDYLLFTSLCHIGIICYDPMILNDAFCAPNKIYEYSAFGKPILGNNIPGLKVLEYNRFGTIVDEQSVDSIISGIKRIETNYEDYCKNGKEFFANCQNDKTILNALQLLEK